MQKTNAFGSIGRVVKTRNIPLAKGYLITNDLSSVELIITEDGLSQGVGVRSKLFNHHCCNTLFKTQDEATDTLKNTLDLFCLQLKNNESQLYLLNEDREKTDKLLDNKSPEILDYEKKIKQDQIDIEHLKSCFVAEIDFTPKVIKG